MGLKIVFGRASTGKTEYCYEEIAKNLIEAGPKELILIVPDQIAMSEEMEAVKRFGAVGLNGIEVFTFRWLYEKYAQLEPERTKEPLTNVGRSMLIRKLLKEKKEELKIYHMAAEKRGFIPTVEKTFREFKRYNIDSRELLPIVEAGIEKGFVDEKTKDLVLLYEAYGELIQNRYLDGDDGLNRLAVMLENRLYEPPTNKKFWIDGFKDFTPQELRVLETILCTGKDLVVTLCIDSMDFVDTQGQGDLFGTGKRTLKRLVEMTEKCRIPVEFVELQALRNRNRNRPENQLEMLERRFFQPGEIEVGTPRTSGENQIEIFEAKEMWSELDFVARRITQLCREEGYRYQDISVVTGDLESYGRFLERVFSQYDIPVFFDEKKKLSNHPFMTVLFSIFDIWNSHWSYESVFRLLKSAYWEMTFSEVDLFENFCLKYGVSGSYLVEDARWDTLLERIRRSRKKNLKSSAEGDEELLRMSNFRALAIVDLKEFYEKGSGTGRELVDRLFQFFEDRGITEKLQEECDRFDEVGDEQRRGLYERVWKGFIEILDQIAETSGDERMDLTEFGELLELGFQELSAGMAPATIDQVLVGDLDRSRHHKLKALFVLGVNEETFPAVLPKVGIISDRERNYFEEMGCRMAPDTIGAMFEKEYLVYRTFSAPTEKLLLSYPVTDLSGSGKRPARIIKELREFFPQLEFSSEITGKVEEMAKISKPLPTLNRIYGEIAEGETLSDASRAALNWMEADENWREKVLFLESAAAYRPAGKGVSGEPLQKMAGGDLFSSVSRLETYKKCPFAWFVEGALHGKDREVFQVNMMDIGNFIHEVVYETISTIQEMGKDMKSIDRAELERIQEKVFLSKSEEGILATKGRYRYLSSRLNRVTKRALKMIATQFRKSKFTNFGNELEFGSHSAIGDAGLRLSDGSFLRIKGRVDRLDLYQTGEQAYIRIVDYKTGKKTLSLSDVYYGLELQLLGYMSCITEKGLPNIKETLKPAAALYFHLDDPMVKGEKGTTEEEIEAAKTKMLRMSGLANSTPEVLAALDEEAETKESSMDINPKKGFVDEESFEKLAAYARNEMAGCGESIKKGWIAPSPICKDGEYACIYCRFRSICKFDAGMLGSEGRLIRKLSDEVAFERIMKKAGEADER